MESLVSAPLPTRSFWAGKRVLLTGHTGFKGSWTALWLSALGAEVTGYALAPDTRPNLFDRLSPIPGLKSIIGDLRDESLLWRTVSEARPQIVLHMAAQALVRRSYRKPIETFAVNALGTAMLLDSLREVPELQAALMVTTDKVYKNSDHGRPFVEDDPLGGADPYSASKAAAEIVTASWTVSYFPDTPIASARAGNVIGGGDWSEDRLVPDQWRAVQADAPLVLRNPLATRPWQHVLDPICGYLVYLEQLAAGKSLPRALNFGPPAGEVMTVETVVNGMLAALGSRHSWALETGAQPHEMKLLALDASLAQRTLGWRPRLGTADALEWTSSWYSAFDAGRDVLRLTEHQIEQYQCLTMASA